MKNCIKVVVTVIGEPDDEHEYSLSSRDDLKFSGEFWMLTDIHGKEAHFPAAAVYVEVG